MAPLLTLTTSARTIRLRIDWMATVANASPAVRLWDPDGLPVGSRATDDDRARHGDLPCQGALPVLSRPRLVTVGNRGSEHGSSRSPIARDEAAQLAIEGSIQPSRTDSVRAVSRRTLTCSEESPARHSTDHG